MRACGAFLASPEHRSEAAARHTMVERLVCDWLDMKELMTVSIVDQIMGDMFLFECWATDVVYL